MKRTAKTLFRSSSITLSTAFSILLALLALLSARPPALGDYSASVDPSIQYQTLEGWGTSLAWWAKVVGGYPDAYRNDYADKIFDPVLGLGLNVVRYNIGGGENPAYHFLPFRAAVPGYEPSPGVWDWSADANQRWIFQAAIDRGADQVEAFSNSPPYWMTNSGSVTGAAGGGDNLNPSYVDAFADYLTEVVKHFQESWGITFRTLEPLNEPIASWWRFGGGQEGCHFDRSSQNTILQRVGDFLVSKGLSTTVSAPDEYSIDEALASFDSYSSPVKSVLSQINTHSYNGSQRTQLANQANSYSKSLWMSEYGDNAISGLIMSQRILSDMKILRPTAWIYWQAVDNAGGWGLLSNPLNGSSSYAYTINKKYYVMGNYSKFIRPGYRFIAINDANSLAAYDASSGTLVIVTTNVSGADTNVTYDLSGFDSVADTVFAYRTSSNENLASLPGIAVSNGSFTAVARAGSVTTYVVSGAVYTGGLGLDPSAYYKLVNRHSGLVLDVNGASTTEGASIIQWYGNAGANQQWSLVGLGGGTYELVSRKSGLVLDVSGASTADGAGVIQWHDTLGSNQQWSLVDTGDGYYKLVNRNSGLNLAVDGGSTTGGARTIQWHDDGSDSQQWRITTP